VPRYWRWLASRYGRLCWNVPRVIGRRGRWYRLMRKIWSPAEPCWKCCHELDKRPLSVTILGCLYMGVGTIGFANHFTEFLAFQYDGLWVELIEILAILCGAFMLRGHNWARWVALAWIAFHAILSAFHAFREFAIHCLFCAVIAWFLFRPEAARYFRGVGIEPT
jgi:hypothetical protein